MVGTFHRSGGSVLYYRAAARWRVPWRLGSTSAAPYRKMLETPHEKALGGSYEIVGNGVDVERFCDCRAVADRRPNGHVRRASRAAKRAGGPARGVRPSRQSACGLLDRRSRSGDRQTERAPTRRADHSSGSARSTTTELARRLRGAQVACFPSLGGESFGVVLLEAMAARIGDRGERPARLPIGRRPNVSRFVRPGDVRELASGLRIALADAESGEGASSRVALEAGRAHAARFSMASMAGHYVSVYEEAIGTSGRPLSRGAPAALPYTSVVPASNGPGKPQGQGRKRSGPGNSSGKLSLAGRKAESRPLGDRTATGRGRHPVSSRQAGRLRGGRHPEPGASRLRPGLPGPGT